MCACTRAKNETLKDSLEDHHQVSIRLEKPYYWKDLKYNKMATITANDWPRSLRILIYLFLMKKWVYDLTKGLFQHEENA